jgi:hypothetical protein
MWSIRENGNKISISENHGTSGIAVKISFYKGRLFGLVLIHVCVVKKETAGEASKLCCRTEDNIRICYQRNCDVCQSMNWKSNLCGMDSNWQLSIEEKIPSSTEKPIF